jgi:hypothetical protein
MITPLARVRLSVMAVLSVLSSVAGAQQTPPADTAQTDASVLSDTTNQVPPWWYSPPNTASDVQQSVGQPNCQTQNCFQSYSPPPPPPPTTFNWEAACGSLGWMGTGLSVVGAPELGVPLGYAGSACKVGVAGVSGGVTSGSKTAAAEGTGAIVGAMAEGVTGSHVVGAFAEKGASALTETAINNAGFAASSSAPPVPQPSPQPAPQPQAGFGWQPVDAPVQTSFSSPTPSPTPNSANRPLDDAIDDAPTGNATAQTASGSPTPSPTPGTTPTSADQTQNDSDDDSDLEDKRARRAAISSISSKWNATPLGAATHNDRAAPRSTPTTSLNSRTQGPGVPGRQGP